MGVQGDLVPELEINWLEALIQIFVSPSQIWGSVHVIVTTTVEVKLPYADKQVVS